MKLNAYGLFLILLLALILCSFFGCRYREGLTSNTFTGPEGNQATVYTAESGRKAVAKDDTLYYNSDYNSSSSSTSNSNSNSNSTSNGDYSSTTYSGPQGNQATVYTGPQGNQAVSTNSGTYTNNDDSDDYDVNTYTGPAGNQATVYTGPQGNQAVVANAGINRSQIPPGQEDLYILKSEIVPPVCPACPQAAACPRQEPCQPCPPCARCPEPAFECKKVPNYNSSNDQFLPRPVMADFSQFGL
jgi:hypothetical protein